MGRVVINRKSKTVWEIFLDYLYIVVGVFIVSAALALFINPARIAAGGVSGIATILFHTLGIDVGLSIFVLSVPIFLAGVLVFGKKYGFKSLFGTACLSLFTSLLIKVFGAEGFLDYGDSVSLLLSAVFGGVVSGIGMGIVMKSGSNTGGTDIIAQIIAKYTPLSLGTALSLIDGLIILASAFIFGAVSALYAVITVYITGVAIDKVVVIGTNIAKNVFIIPSGKDCTPIRDYILNTLEHSATIIDAQGMYTEKDRKIIMVVVKNNELPSLMRAVHRTDPMAFIVISDAYNVLGEGFSPISDYTK